MQKIRITKKGRSVKVAEVNRNILGALSYFSLKTGKPVDFEKTLSYSLSPLPLSTRWNSSTNTKVQIKRNFTARSRRSYQRRTTVSSRIWNYCRYCINDYHP